MSHFLKEWMQIKSDRIEAIYAELERIDDEIYRLNDKYLSNEYIKESCETCGRCVQVNKKPKDPNVNVAEINKRIRDLRNEWDRVDSEINEIVAEVEDKLEELTKGTIFSIYGVDVN